ncbi:MAG: ferrochelatase, partial [Parvularculaceae bacterium]|nr:ferrochelatase [Parvularculaceae bacterium]
MNNDAQTGWVTSLPGGPHAADEAEVRPADHPDVAAGRTGVLIVNLGTPEAPTPGAVRAYLAEFLSDTRVVDYPRAIWLPILYGIILNVRPAKSARAYAKIWTAEGSPLRRYAVAAAEKLAARYGERL